MSDPRHYMWPEYRSFGEGFRHEDSRCSCGFEQRESTWLDDVMLSDISRAGHRNYLIAYPDEEYPETTGGVKKVTSHGSRDLGRHEIVELLKRDDLPDEFRRAAAVHLPQS